MRAGQAQGAKRCRMKPRGTLHIAAREVSGASAYHIYRKAEDTLAERLRRRPAKPMGSPRVGSNPTGVDSLKQKHDNRSTPSSCYETASSVGAERSVQKQKRSWSTQKQMRWGRSCSTEGHAMGGKSARLGYSRQAWPSRQASAAHSRSISGLVVEYIIVHRCDPGSIPG